MVSSVKPWALVKLANFSFTSALGVWVRPGQEREAWPQCRRTLLCPHLRLGEPHEKPLAG